MKRYILFACLFLIVVVLACKDKDEIAPSDQYPEWLQLKITELISSGNDCQITDLSIIEFKGQKYYHIYSGLWSCMYCQFFDESGIRPDWHTEQWNDFSANKKELKKIPACSVMGEVVSE